MNIKPNELAMLAAGVLPPTVQIRASEEIARVLPNVGRTATRIQQSYDARMAGSLDPDYSTIDAAGKALVTFHGRVAQALSMPDANLVALNSRFATESFFGDLLATPLSKQEVAGKLESLCKIVDNPARSAQHSAARVFALQLAADVSRLGSITELAAKDRIGEILKGASLATLFRPAPLAAAPTQTATKPTFSTVTGHDFGRSIRWARTAPNELKDAVRAAKDRLFPTREGVPATPPVATRPKESSNFTQATPGSLRQQLARLPSPARPVSIARGSPNLAAAVGVAAAL